jgi:NitT/TauT family transport system substrate-binding protein
MHIKLGLLSALIGGVAVATLVTPGAAFAEKIRIAHSTWVGYGPLYIAQEKGFFKKNGVDVDLVVMRIPRSASRP